jgi:hypothetical protein
MSILVLNISTLTNPQKLAKGYSVISLSTDNPNVPGNEAPLALFSTAQDGLQAAFDAAEEARMISKQRTEALQVALAQWATSLSGLGGFTQNATGGDAEKILSAGFDVRGEPAPPHPVGQVLGVRVSFNGTPGYSTVTWNRDPHADAYMVQCSPDPITPTSWVNKGTVTRNRYEGTGATPGQLCWYRVAAVNAMGQGAWSEPALRPVM